MQVSNKEMRAVVKLLEDMTSYETGSHGLGHKEKVTLQLMFGRFADHVEALEIKVVEEDGPDG